MGRPARYIPENKNGVLVEVSCRCIGGKALLTPGPNPFKFNELVAGIIGRALEISPLDLCSAIFVSNHWHGLVVVHDQQTLSRFMAHVGCKVYASYCTSFLLSCLRAFYGGGLKSISDLLRRGSCGGSRVLVEAKSISIVVKLQES